MEELDFLENASASFTEIEQNGTAIMPLPFDDPQVGVAKIVDAQVYNPHTQDILKVSNIIYEQRIDGRTPERAYWVGRKLKKCIFGVVKECTVLRFRNDPDIHWEVTEQKVAGKIMSWQKNKRSPAHRGSLQGGGGDAIYVERRDAPPRHGGIGCVTRRRLSDFVHAILYVGRPVWFCQASHKISRKYGALLVRTNIRWTFAFTTDGNMPSGHVAGKHSCRRVHKIGGDRFGDVLACSVRQRKGNRRCHGGRTASADEAFNTVRETELYQPRNISE
mmetsp:Transcript_27908/g.60071  ORF Transcript_27908/g.60071 Transcript_27908/m.60071 type:complete len:276 (-) Transcript_27908:548-1375(-)